MSARWYIPLEHEHHPLHATTTSDLPSGMALSPDGTRLYVALNGVNELGVINTATNQLIQVIPVGNAPRQVVLANNGQDAFVSNEGGRPARPGDFTNKSAGTAIVASKVTGAASPARCPRSTWPPARRSRQIRVGLEPTAEYLAPDGTLMVANSNDDTYLADRHQDGHGRADCERQPAARVDRGQQSQRDHDARPRPHPGQHRPGQRPGGLRLQRPADARCRYEGLLPTDFYPVGAAYDPAIGKVVVTNDKGIGARGPGESSRQGARHRAGGRVGHRPQTPTSDTGSVTEFAMPGMPALGAYTHQVFVDNNWEHLLASTPLRNCAAAPPGRPAAPRLPVQDQARLPDHPGEPHLRPGPRRHREGQQRPRLAQFGATITPNAHALATTFGLFDNFYDPGTLSADGHNWLVQADANDYMEKEFGAFYRSYPAQGGDALAYQRDGFLWDAAEAAGQTVKVYGEYNHYLNQPGPAPSWSQYYR